MWLEKEKSHFLSLLHTQAVLGSRARFGLVHLSFMEKSALLYGAFFEKKNDKALIYKHLRQKPTSFFTKGSKKNPGVCDIKNCSTSWLL